MNRSISQVALMIAALRMGVVFVNLHPGSTAFQVQNASRLCPLTMLIAGRACLMRVSKTKLEELKDIRIAVLDDSLNQEFDISLCTDIDPIVVKLDSSMDYESKPQDSVISKNDPAAVLFTSGSTGEPKGVQISYGDLCERVKSEAAAYRLSDHDRLLNVLPFSFDAGLNQLFTALACGSEIVLLNSWFPQDILSAMRQYDITGISGVPSIWLDMLAFSQSKPLDDCPSLRYITVSGGDMPEAKLRELRRLLPSVDIYKTFGQTEAFRSTMLMPEDFDRKMTSVGKPINSVQMFIRKEDGSIAQPGECGEIVHQGMGTMMGYVGDATATGKKIRALPFGDENPAVFTGDIGMMDEDGYLYVFERNDDMVKIRGNRVYPKEIENALGEHEKVKESVVFGLPDESGQTRLTAVVSSASNESLRADELKAFLSQRLLSYMMPERIVIAVSLPRTASGKIDRQAVKTTYMDFLKE